MPQLDSKLCSFRGCLHAFVPREASQRFCSIACWNRELAIIRTRPIEQRFWPKVDKTPGHGPWGDCWLWTACLNNKGYGYIGVGGRADGKVLAHRIAWELEHGPIPEGLEICHSCDNPPCVRYTHLFPGSHLQNIMDASRKGRMNRGESNGNARLSIDDIREIRLLGASETLTLIQIAERFEISKQHAGAIVRLEFWKHVV